MANFTTHITVAAMTSTALATIGVMGGAFGFGTAIFCLLVGIVGGMLPDIDLETSKPARHAFNLMSLFVASLLAIVYASGATGDVVRSALMVWGGAFVVVRYGIIGLFSRITKHRGMIHSVPYMALFALLGVYGAFYGLQLTAQVSWFLGLFLFAGALVHLILDEIYSVNVLGMRMKKSAGTAFKFFESDKSIFYIILYACVAALWYFAPDLDSTLLALKKLWINFANIKT